MNDFCIRDDGNVTVRKALSLAERALALSAVDNPLLDSEWMLSHLFDVGRLELPLISDRKLKSAERKLFSEWIERRSRREPLQYVLGNTLFADLNLKVDERSLVPRPETEDLLSRVISKAKHGPPPKRILDLGTGSGALALGLAAHFSSAEIVGVDASLDALTLAAENAARNGLTTNVTFFASNWFQRVTGLFDVIVSNPPYLDEKEWIVCAPEVRDFEPKQALVADPLDSAADLKRIVLDAKPRLKPNGILFLETGEGHHEILFSLAKETGYVEVNGQADLRGRPRFFFARNEN